MFLGAALRPLGPQGMNMNNQGMLPPSSAPVSMTGGPTPPPGVAQPGGGIAQPQYPAPTSQPPVCMVPALGGPGVARPSLVSYPKPLPTQNPAPTGRSNLLEIPLSLGDKTAVSMKPSFSRGTVHYPCKSEKGVVHQAS